MTAERLTINHRRRNAVQKRPALPTTNRGKATREKLKAALSALLERKAYEEIRLKDIAAEADVPVSLIYHYFQSKVDGPATYYVCMI